MFRRLREGKKIGLFDKMFDMNRDDELEYMDGNWWKIRMRCLERLVLPLDQEESLIQKRKTYIGGAHFGNIDKDRHGVIEGKMIELF